MVTFKESFKKKEEAKEEALVENEYKNLTRYIPSGAQVITDLTEKSLTIKIVTGVSAPPLNTGDMPSIERRLKKDLKLFIKDVEGELELSDVSVHPYIFMEGQPKAIWFYQEVTFRVKNKTEGKKLALLDEALAFKKKRTAPMS